MNWLVSGNISRTIPPSGHWIEKIRKRAYINMPLRMGSRKFSGAFAHDALYRRGRIAYALRNCGASTTSIIVFLLPWMSSSKSKYEAGVRGVERAYLYWFHDIVRRNYVSAT